MRIQKDFDPHCAGSDDAQIIIWDAETGAFLASNNMHQFRVLQVIFANESQVISMSNNKLIMWDSPATSFKGSLDVVDFRRYMQSHIEDLKYSSNKIRKTQNKHMNIICQNLNSR